MFLPAPNSSPIYVGWGQRKCTEHLFGEILCLVGTENYRFWLHLRFSPQRLICQLCSRPNLDSSDALLLNSSCDSYSLSAASHTSHCPSVSRDCDLSSRMTGCWGTQYGCERCIRLGLASGVFLPKWELAVSTEMFKRASFLPDLVGSCHPFSLEPLSPLWVGLGLNLSVKLFFNSPKLCSLQWWWLPCTPGKQGPRPELKSQALGAGQQFGLEKPLGGFGIWEQSLAWDSQEATIGHSAKAIPAWSWCHGQPWGGYEECADLEESWEARQHKAPVLTLT